MKKAFFALVLLLAATATSFADSQPTRRYIVTMRDTSVRPFAERRADDAEVRVVDELRHLDSYVVDMTEAQAQRLRSRRGVRAVEPDHEVHILGNAAPIATSRVRGVQTMPYGIQLVRAPEVWPYATGTGIKVGIIDTGMDYTHPDLRGAFRGGRDFVNNDDDPMDDNGHGTHVAGTIAAANDSDGVVGVAPGVELYSLKVLNASGSGSLSNIIRALDWAIDHQLNVLNLSLGSDEPSDSEDAAFAKVAGKGILAIAASGNDYDTLQHDFIAYPAAYSSVVAVGAIDSTSAIASFSQRGPELKVVAPGVNVLSDYRVGMNKIALVQSGNREFETLPMEGSPERDVTGRVVFCGFGKPSEFPAAVAGNIALIQRSLASQPEAQRLTFAQKAMNAKTAGAIGVLIFNREPGTFGGTLINADDPAPPGYEFLPTVSMSLEDGMTLKGREGEEVTLRFGITDDYAELQGTSMATPHATGVAALIWSLRPSATAAEVSAALFSTASDLGAAGFDNTFGWGRVNAYDAARRLSPSTFIPPTPGPRRRPVRH